MTFDKWFKAQYRCAPMSGQRRRDVERRLADAHAEVAELSELIANDDKIVAARQGALYAWTCSDAYKREAKP